MASVKTAPAKPAAPVAPKAAPPKAAPPKAAPPKAAPPKAAPAPAKPAPVAAAPAAKPAAPAPPKAAPASAVPLKAAPAVEYVTKADFEAFKAELKEFVDAMTDTTQAHNARIAQIELLASGFGQYASIDAEGNLVLDIANADRESLRQWSFQFGLAYDGETEAFRAALQAKSSAKDFAGWEVVNAGDVPAEGEAPVAEAVAEEEGVELTEEVIAKMNWKDLASAADQIGIDYSDIQKPQQPKVLRTRLLEALATAQAAEGDAGEEGQAITAGAALLVTIDDQAYEAVFVQENEDGTVLVQWADGEQASVDPASISLPE